MIINDYPLIKLDDLDYDSKTSQILKNIISKSKNSELNHNLIFNGIRSSGKKTRILCFLNDLNNEKINFNISNIIINKSIDLHYLSYKNYFQFCPFNYGNNDKDILNDFILHLVQTKNLINNNSKIFIITKADKLTVKAQNILNNIIDKYGKIAKFILTTENYSILNNKLLSKFLILKIKNPSSIECKNIIKKYNIFNNTKLSLADENNIINQSKKYDNIINIDLLINILKKNIINKNFTHNNNIQKIINNKFIYNIDIIIKYINSSNLNLNNFNDIKNTIYILYVNNYPIINIFHYLINYFLNTNLIIHKKINIILYAAKYSNLMIHGNKYPLYLEIFILYIINTIHNTL